MEERRSTVHKLDSPVDRVVPRPEEPRPEEPAQLPPPHPARRRGDTPHVSTYVEDDSIDLLALWRLLAEYKRVIGGLFLLALLLSGATAWLMTPVYRAELTVAPATEEEGSRLSALSGQFGGLASLAGVNLDTRGNDMDRMLATLTSRVFIMPFLDKEKAMPVLYAEQWDAANSSWKSGIAQEEIPSALDAYQFFVDEIVDIHKEHKSGLVTIGVEWEDPKLAAQWANQLISLFNEYQRQSAIQEAQRSIEYLNQQLKDTSVVDMQKAIYHLIESQTKVIMLANVKRDYALQVIDPAVAPEEPVRPNRPLILIVGAMLGLMLAVFVVLVMNLVRNIKQQG
jgi:LPS O-antigen subunit length determinant protein (WzzB/FepE family)